MTAVRAGDLAKLGVLFERYHAALFDFLSRMTGDRAVAEDLVQDIFVRILKYRATYRDGGRFETWLYRIARNARTEYFRTRRALEPLADEAFEHPEPNPGPMRQLEAARDRSRLKQALLQLPDEKRELLVLARFHGMKHEQIAELLGIETGAVKVRIHRALRGAPRDFPEAVGRKGPMRCEDVHAQLADHLADTLGPEAARDLADHLRTCESCAAAVNELGTTWQLLGAVRGDRPDSPAMRARFEGMLDGYIEGLQTQMAPVRVRWMRTHGLRLAAAAALLAVGVGVGR